MTRYLRYAGNAAVSGVIGWMLLMAAFEGAYWVCLRKRGEG